MLTTNPLDDDHLREECGVFGVFGHVEAATLVALGLHALQHRGQEAAGIVTYDGKEFPAHRAMGLVGEHFSSKEVIGRLKGHSAIGHVRYATTGEVAMRNVQPLFNDFDFGGLAICHNGNLTNSYHLRRQLMRRGCLFQTTSDTEVINHLIATSLKHTVEERMIDALRQVEGAYSLVALTQDGVIGVRDPLGVRPLVLGRLGDAWILASETCALERIGAELARESQIAADIVVPVPDSGVPAALGYSQESGLPFELGIIRNHYVGRTFIEPTDQIRHLGVKLKHNANRAKLQGKRVVLVDDSIVRGTTSTKIVEMVRQAGASEVHMRISSPPTSHSCFYGIATPERYKLLASHMDVPEMARFIGADSLAISGTSMCEASSLSRSGVAMP